MEIDQHRGIVLHADLSHQILGIAFEVHNQLGPGFTENLYEQAYVCELKSRGIAYEQQKEILVSYKGMSIGTYRLDLVIDGKVIVELKAVSQLTDLFKAQLASYLKAAGLQLGYMINFGNRKVDYARVIHTAGAIPSVAPKSFNH